MFACLSLLMGPARAQYGPSPTTTSSSTTSTTAPSTLDDNRTEGNVSPDKTTPGSTVTFTAPAGSFSPGTPVTYFIARAVEGASGQQIGGGTADGSGGASSPLVVPANLPAGVYYIYVVGTGPDGEQRVSIAPVVVGSPGAASAGTATPIAPAGVTPPAEVVALQQPAPVEAAVARAAANGAGVAVQGNELVTTPSPSTKASSNGFALTGAEIGTAVAIALAAILVGAGLLSLRRRSPGVKA